MRHFYFWIIQHKAYIATYRAKLTWHEVANLTKENFWNALHIAQILTRCFQSGDFFLHCMARMAERSRLNKLLMKRKENTWVRLQCYGTSRWLGVSKDRLHLCMTRTKTIFGSRCHFWVWRFSTLPSKKGKREVSNCLCLKWDLIDHCIEMQFSLCIINGTDCNF